MELEGLKEHLSATSNANSVIRANELVLFVCIVFGTENGFVIMQGGDLCQS